MTYTSADYERVLGDFHATPTQPFTERSLIMMAALRIASRVMAEGVIASVIFNLGTDMDDMSSEAIAAAIRAALLEDAGT